MFKRIIILVILLVVLIPGSSLASGLSGEYYPPSDSDYSSKKFSWQLYFSKNVNQLRFTQYDMNDVKKGQITYTNVPGNSKAWMDFNCPGKLYIEFSDKNGVVLKTFARGQAASYLNGSTCNYKNFATVSDFDDRTGKYKTDRFKQTKPKNKKADLNKGAAFSFLKIS